MYITTLYAKCAPNCKGTVGATQVWQHKGMRNWIHIPQTPTVDSSLTVISKVPKFWSIKDKTLSKRLLLICPPLVACPFTEKDGHMKGEAKVRFNCELWIMNYEEFCGICWKTQIQGQFTNYKVQFIRLIRSTVRRVFVDSLSARSKVKSQRSKD